MERNQLKFLQFKMKSQYQLLRLIITRMLNCVGTILKWEQRARGLRICTWSSADGHRKCGMSGACPPSVAWGAMRMWCGLRTALACLGPAVTACALSLVLPSPPCLSPMLCLLWSVRWQTPACLIAYPALLSLSRRDSYLPCSGENIVFLLNSLYIKNIY